jgi:hypothetical protein
MVIVTHQSPDFDAVGAVWLLKRYNDMEDGFVEFVNTGNPSLNILNQAEAVVDTGKIYDPLILRFDHHQLPGKAANETCATKQVYDYLLQKGRRIEHLYPLIELIFFDDTGQTKKDCFQTQQVGIHSVLKGFSKTKQKDGTRSDYDTLEFGMSLLDCIDQNLKTISEARKSLEDHVVYRSKDNKLWALENASEDVSSAAFEQGADIVLFTSRARTDSGISHGIGLWRSLSCSEPDCGSLVDKLLQNGADAWIKTEIRTWFKHPAGFYAGRGGLKAPCFEPVLVPQIELAQLFDAVWEREHERENS